MGSTVYNSSTYADYQEETVLGRGGSGTVFRCVHIPSSEICAVKRISLPQPDSAADVRTRKACKENRRAIFQAVRQVCLSASAKSFYSAKAVVALTCWGQRRKSIFKTLRTHHLSIL